jgi:hypothetical protein
MVRVTFASGQSEIESVSIPHPETRRSRGHLLTAYIVFCAVRGCLQVFTAWSMFEGVPPSGHWERLAVPMAIVGGLDLLGAFGVWRWWWTGAVLLGLSAAGTIAIGISGGSSVSVTTGGLLLAAALIAGIGVPWRLTCLRCRAVVLPSDAVCPSCGQPFSG